MTQRLFQVAGSITGNTLKITAWFFFGSMALFVLAGPPLLATGLLMAAAWNIHPWAGALVGLAGATLIIAGAATLWRSIMD